MKLKNGWVFAGVIMMAGGAVIGFPALGSSTYEFPSCDPGSKVINVMRVPYGYQSSAESIRIRDDQPVGWTEKEANGPATYFKNGGLLHTILYSTYPEYLPLGFTSWREYSRMEYESGAPDKLLFATVVFSRGPGVSPHDSSFIHDPAATRKNSIERIREDSIDGQYWTYPPYDQRTSRSTGRPTYFMPKDMGLHVLIGCADIGVNAIPKDGRCFVRSDWGDDANLGCRSVEYRMAAKDIANWRVLDARVKQQIEALISQRIHGYDEAESTKGK